MWVLNSTKGGWSEQCLDRSQWRQDNRLWKSESIGSNMVCTSEGTGSVPSVTNWTPASSNATFNPSLHNGRFVPSNVITWFTLLFEQLPVHAILYSNIKEKIIIKRTNESHNPLEILTRNGNYVCLVTCKMYWVDLRKNLIQFYLSGKKTKKRESGRLNVTRKLSRGRC
jgi:hypothetical protein